MNNQNEKKIFVVLSRTDTKIWKNDFNSGAIPITFVEEFVNRDYKKIINQYFSGRNRSKMDPQFVERVAKELIGFDRIYFAGGGKGKASAVNNLTAYLRAHQPLLAKNIRAIKDIDASHMTDNELLAMARQLEDADLLEIHPGQA